MSTLKTSNIFDPIEKALDQKVFDGIEPKEKHINYILRLYARALKQHFGIEGDGWTDLYFTGSLTTYQYGPTSDCDISVFANWDRFMAELGMDANEARKRLIAMSIEHLDGTFLPGTTHPLQFFVVPQGTLPSDLYQPGLRSAYSLDDKMWYQEPEPDRVHDVANELPELYQRAADMAEKMTEMLEHDPEQARQLFHDIHSKRTLDQRAGLGDFSEGNIVYKYLLHEGLFDRIREELGEYIAKVGAPTQVTPYSGESLQAQFGTAFVIYTVFDSAEEMVWNRGSVNNGPYLYPDTGGPVMFVHWAGNEKAEGDTPEPRDVAAMAQWLRAQNLPVYADISNDELKQLAERKFKRGGWKIATPPAGYVPEFLEQYRQTPQVDPGSQSQGGRGYDWQVNPAALARLMTMTGELGGYKTEMPPIRVQIMNPYQDEWKRLLGYHEFDRRRGHVISIHPLASIEDANETLWHEIQHAYQSEEGRMDRSNYNWQNPADPSQYAEHPIERDAEEFARYMNQEPLVVPAPPQLDPNWVPRELHLDRGEWNEEREEWLLSHKELATELGAQVNMFRKDWNAWQDTWLDSYDYDQYHSKRAGDTSHLWEKVNTKVIYDFENDNIILGTQALANDLPDTKIIGEYDGESVTLFEAEKQWINPDYFHRLWSHTFPNRPLNGVYFKRGDGSQYKLKTRKRPAPVEEEGPYPWEDQDLD